MLDFGAGTVSAGDGPIAVIARQMNMIRDECIAELFDMMKAEIQGLDHDTQMMGMWRANLTENYLAAVHHLERDAPTSLLEAPATALACARACAAGVWPGGTGAAASPGPLGREADPDGVCVLPGWCRYIGLANWVRSAGGTRPPWDSCHRSCRMSTTTPGQRCPGRRDCRSSPGTGQNTALAHRMRSTCST
ncbi:hypothetical protein MSHI_17820 [Mycobacterium shinjukuense]|uniref:Uncharacterized protein n=1 Tax=Mycobacterium shinjukuense TaxID=398694 RepID=A0A7I7MP26_9MYCO|nr:hypothetical protein MSHI_17820 [Mycobacterium shinjukuense]